MAGNTNFPTALDDDSSLIDVTDGVTAIEAAHHNNLKEALKALQAKVGIYNTAAPTALDYRLGHPSFGHRHDGASGQGPLIVSGGGASFFGAHPSRTDRVLFQLPVVGIGAPIGTSVPTAWPNTYITITDTGTISVKGALKVEHLINNGAPGGPRQYSKHTFLGGWGIVVPALATSGLHATYSEAAQIYYDSVANKVKLWTGATWRSLAME